MAEAKTPRSRLVLSITAHERIDVLCDQIDNVLTMCPGARIVLHLNHDFRAALADDLLAAPLLRRLCAHPDVVLNPEHLCTRWGHMFHAHVSNLNLIIRTGLDCDHVMLMSSADIVIRAGLPEYIADQDIGVNVGWDADWIWRPHVDADPVVTTLRTVAGQERYGHGFHEGSFYRRAIIETMLRVLNEAVPDWDYNQDYPKEEVFLPTLSHMFAGARRGPSLARVLGFGTAGDTAVLRRALRHVGLADANPLLKFWCGDAPDGDEAPPFIISRIPRRREDPLRLLLGDVTPHGASARAHAVAARLRPADLLALELPGRTNEPGPPSDMLRDLVGNWQRGMAVTQGPYLAQQTDYPPCPQGITEAIPLTPQLAIGMMNVPDGVTRLVTMPHGGDRVQIAARNPAMVSGGAWSLAGITLHWVLPTGTRPRLLRLHVWTTQVTQLRFDLHTMHDGALRSFDLTPLCWQDADTGATIAACLLTDEDLDRIHAADTAHVVSIVPLLAAPIAFGAAELLLN